jgi:hypothetical protein
MLSCIASAQRTTEARARAGVGMDITGDLLICPVSALSTSPLPSLASLPCRLLTFPPPTGKALCTRSVDAFLCGVVCLLVEDALVLAIGSSEAMEQTAAEEQALIPDGSPPRFGVAHRGEAHLCGVLPRGVILPRCGVEAPPAMTQFSGVEAPRGVAGRCCITMAVRGVPRKAVCG